MITIRGPIPITIRFAFWVTAGIIGFINSFSLIGTLLWVGIIFISIIVHELGHAITAKAFGQKPRIELIAFGGLTYPEGKKIKRWKEFIVVFNGPLFGFGLFLLSALLLQVPALQEGLIGGVLKITKFVNLFWTAFNLLPIFPLDGGQLLRITFEGIFGSKGFRYALIVGMCFGFATATIAIFIGFFLLGAFMFIFAFQSFEIWRRAKNMTEIDRDDTLTAEIEAVEKLLSENRIKEAIPHLETLTSRTKKGMIFQRCSELLAQIRADDNDWDAVYQILKPIDDLSPPARFLLHKAAFEQKDYPLVLKLGAPCFQDLPDADIALNNAMAAAALKQLEPTIGWLQSSVDAGLTNLKDVIQNPIFDPVRDDKAFIELLDD